MNPILAVLLVLAGLALLYAAIVLILGISIFDYAVKRSRKQKLLKDDDYGDYKREGLRRLACLEAEEFMMTAEDGVRLRGRLLRNPSGGGGKILLSVHGFHCDGENELAGQSGYWLSRGFDIFVADNRGHGLSGGDYIGFGTLDARDLKRWLNFLGTRYAGRRIYILGVSMGCTAVLNACDQLPVPVEGIVADCGFTSVREQLNHVLRFFKPLRGPAVSLASRLCLRKAGYGFDRENTLAHVPKAAAPILFIHGGADDYVPTYMTKQNYEACGARKALLIIPGATHPRSHFVDPALYERSIDEFFNLTEKREEKEI